MNREELLELRDKTTQFISDIFDHVGILNQEAFLAHIYKFEQAIEDRINGSI